MQGKLATSALTERYHGRNGRSRRKAPPMVKVVVEPPNKGLGSSFAGIALTLFSAPTVLAISKQTVVVKCLERLAVRVRDDNSLLAPIRTKNELTHCHAS
jgi:hypothetical protein